MLLLILKKLEIPLMVVAMTVIAVRDLNERLHRRAPVPNAASVALEAHAR